MAVITKDSEVFVVSSPMFVPVRGPAVPEDELVFVDAEGQTLTHGGRVVGVTGVAEIPERPEAPSALPGVTLIGVGGERLGRIES